jgi:hypothetical protein
LAQEPGDQTRNRADFPRNFPGSSSYVSVKEWLAFLDDADVEASVLYPTAGLGVGLIEDAGWASVSHRPILDTVAHRSAPASAPASRRSGSATGLRGSPRSPRPPSPKR